MPTSYFFLPVVTALVGWLTNVLAVWMLFHPRFPKGFGFIKLQGLVPKRHRALARSISQVIDEELLNREDLVEKFERLEFEEEAMHLLDERLDAFISSVKMKIPMVAMFVTTELEGEIKEQASSEVKKMLPQLRQKIAERLLQQYDVAQLVEEKIIAFELDRLEAIALRVARRELRSIEWLGGLLGFVIGILQLGWMYCSL